MMSERSKFCSETTKEIGDIFMYGMKPFAYGTNSVLNFLTSLNVYLVNLPVVTSYKDDRGPVPVRVIPATHTL